MPPYEELFASGKGFTDPDEAARFARETGVDWLSVACGNVHGALSAAERDKEKVNARINCEHLARLRQATGNIPLVLHGGSGILREYVLRAVGEGITKINIGTQIRQTYERALLASESVSTAQEAVAAEVASMSRDYFGIEGSADRLVAALG
jgi:fructose/tagatose bisphosphate aldolase